MTKDKLALETLRGLSLDTIAKANSGHPGMALSAASILYTLYTRHLVSDVSDPNWINRDRFVLSAGHASALLYSLLHLAGYKISLDDLKNFRQINSLTPGHPEYRHTPGVDATAGPLGQGIAQAVGLAMAEVHLRAIYPEGDQLVNHYTYCLCGDGCLEEGISQEAISIAGTLKLNKLILLYDCNNVTLDGPLSDTSVEDTKERFLAAGWNALEVEDGNNIDDIDKSIQLAKVAKNKPTIIIVKTKIGYGSPLENNHLCHGKPFKPEEVRKIKENLGYSFEPFSVNEEVYKIFRDTFVKRGKENREIYDKNIMQYKKRHPDQYIRFETMKNNDVSPYIFSQPPEYVQGYKNATRNTSEDFLNVISDELPNLFGGSADVAESVKTNIKNTQYFTANNPKGKSIAFGIREFAMASIQNGILLHGGLRTFVGSFLVFSDYMKPAIRMAAMEKLPAVYLFSHDSIAVGEDGPTHQPIEQLTMLRTIPNVSVFRPADAIETACGYRLAFTSFNKPTCLILSRQSLTNNLGSSFEECKKGGYIVSKEKISNTYTIIASGSEVNLAIEVQTMLLKEGIDTRVVSMPSLDIFDSQSDDYKSSILNSSYDNRIFIEMGKSDILYKYAKHVIGIDTFGLSAPADEVLKAFSFTSEQVYSKIKDIINTNY